MLRTADDALCNLYAKFRTPTVPVQSVSAREIGFHTYYADHFGSLPCSAFQALYDRFGRQERLGTVNVDARAQKFPTLNLGVKLEPRISMPPKEQEHIGHAQIDSRLRLHSLAAVVQSSPPPVISLDRKSKGTSDASSVCRKDWQVLASKIFNSLDKWGYGFIDNASVLRLWPTLTHHADQVEQIAFFTQLQQRAEPIGRNEWVELMVALHSILGSRQLRHNLRAVDSLLVSRASDMLSSVQDDGGFPSPAPPAQLAPSVGRLQAPAPPCIQHRHHATPSVASNVRVTVGRTTGIRLAGGPGIAEAVPARHHQLPPLQESASLPALKAEAKFLPSPIKPPPALVCNAQVQPPASDHFARRDLLARKPIAAMETTMPDWKRSPNTPHTQSCPQLVPRASPQLPSHHGQEGNQRPRLTLPQLVPGCANPPSPSTVCAGSSQSGPLSYPNPPPRERPFRPVPLVSLESLKQ